MQAVVGPCSYATRLSVQGARCTGISRCRPLAGRVSRPAQKQQFRMCRSSSGNSEQQVADASGAPAGQISSAVIASMKQKIGEALETDQVQITDVYGDGRHVCIDVISEAFAGQGTMQRQRMVYKAIWLELQEAVHAVDSMTTKTPEEKARA